MTDRQSLAWLAAAFVMGGSIGMVFGALWASRR